MTSDVLLITTDPHIIARTKEALQRLDYSITIAASGVDAFRVLPELQPCLILLEEHLSDTSGHSFIKALHSAYVGAVLPQSTMLIKGGDRSFSEDYSPTFYIIEHFQPGELSALVRWRRNNVPPEIAHSNH